VLMSIIIPYSINDIESIFKGIVRSHFTLDAPPHDLYMM
jgi:hypothetical protein